MNGSKLVTIIVPAYNREATIVRSLDSVAGQRGVGYFSVIVVDNNSSDDTAGTVSRWHESHPEIDLTLTDETKQGASAARNKGLAMTVTPYVMFFDSDDEMLQGHLERIVRGITDFPDADILGWDIVYRYPSGKNYRSFFESARPIYNHLTQSTFTTNKYVAKTDFVRKAGAWNVDLKAWNDYELGVRLLALRPDIVKLDCRNDSPTVLNHFTFDSITGTGFSKKTGLWEKSLDCIEATLKDSGRQDILCWIGYRRAVLAGHYAREGAKSDAARLLAAAPCKGFGRLKARVCYEITRLFGRGARTVASLMLPTYF